MQKQKRLNLELQRKVNKIENEKRKMAKEIKALKEKLGQTDGIGACCCEELRELQTSKEQDLKNIAQAWKQKSMVLAGKYQ